MWSLSEPSVDVVQRFLDTQSGEDWSYPEIGASAGDLPMGYSLDHYRVQLGSGEAAFRRAREALCRWQMFPAPWTRIAPMNAPIETHTVVAVTARAYGLWWLNACRIVYTIDEQSPVRRFGFAYGTLPCHVESGEERFSVEWRADDSVWYDVRAFSRPRLWLVRLAKPLARLAQRRFGRDSRLAMKRATAGDPT